MAVTLFEKEQKTKAIEELRYILLTKILHVFRVNRVSKVRPRFCFYVMEANGYLREITHLVARALVVKRHKTDGGISCQDYSGRDLVASLELTAFDKIGIIKSQSL